MVSDYDGFERAAHLRYVPLPGGDAGVRNPCRMALSHLRAAGIEWDAGLPCVAACSLTERTVLLRQLDRGLNCVPTSSMGRLFDAMSSLAGVCHRVAYEAEAAMRFEELGHDAADDFGAAYAFGLGTDSFDAAPVFAAAATDVRNGVPTSVVAARFHAAVADLVTACASSLRTARHLDVVALSGGVFLNALLTTMCVDRLQHEGFRVLTHHNVPPSDAGLALGQLIVGARRRPTDAAPRRTPCA